MPLAFGDPRITEIKPGMFLGPGFDVPDGEPLRLTSGELNPRATYLGRMFCCGDCQTVMSDADREACTSDGRYYICIGCRGELTFEPGGPAKRATAEIPAAFSHAEVDHHPSGKAAIIKRWARTEKFMVIAGVTGSGKTHGCWGLVKLRARNGLYVRYHDCRSARNFWISGNARDRSDLEYKLVESTFLILDDLSGSSATDGWAELVEHVIDKRLAHERPTLITTLADVDNLHKAGYGEAIMSRLSKFKWVLLPNKDYRKLKPKEEIKQEEVVEEPKKEDKGLFEEIPF